MLTAGPGKRDCAALGVDAIPGVLRSDRRVLGQYEGHRRSRKRDHQVGHELLPWRRVRISYENSALDSRDYFSRSGNTRGAIRRISSAARRVGQSSRDKTFIFGDYEGFRQAKGITTTITVPSDSARAGKLVSGPVTVDPAAAAELAMFPHCHARNLR